jgi:hypothetical protein
MLVVFGIELVSLPEITVGIVDDKKIVCSSDEVNFSGEKVVFKKEDIVENEEITGSVVEKGLFDIVEVEMEKFDVLKVFELIVSSVIETFELSEILFVIRSLVVNSDGKVDEKNTVSVLLFNLVISCSFIVVGNSVTSGVDENKSKFVVSNEEIVEV